MQEGADRASPDGLAGKNQQRPSQHEKSNRIEPKGYIERVNVNEQRPVWSPPGKSTTGWADYIKVVIGSLNMS